jgi:hypothetical protein
MTATPRLASGFRLAAGIGLLLTAGLHGSGYPEIAKLGDASGGDVKLLLPALWLAFSLHYLLFGTLVLFAAGPRNQLTARLLAVAALVPLGDALLQVVYLGFIPPTALLLVIAALSLVAAAATRNSLRPAA